MINIISQPDQWESAYDEVYYRLQRSTRFADGGFSILTGADSTTKLIDSTGITIIPTGDLVQIGLGVYPVLGTSGTYLKVYDKYNVLTLGGYDTNIYQLSTSRIKLRLEVGYRKGNSFSSDRPLEKFVDINCSADAQGNYNVRIGGYLQDAFGEVTVPSIGNDKNLFLHYKLKLYVDYDNGVTYDIGELKYVSNGCVENLNYTDYQTIQKALRVPYNFKINTHPGLESFIINDSIKNRLVTSGYGAFTTLQKAKAIIQWKPIKDGGYVETPNCIDVTQQEFDEFDLIITANGASSGKLHTLKPTENFLTVERSGPAYRTNSSGVLESVASNYPRLDCSLDPTCASILMEPPRTNLIKHSNDFTHSDWGFTQNNGSRTITANYGTAPDGTNTATRIQMSIVNASGNYAHIEQKFASSLTTKYSNTIWVKSLSGTPVVALTYDGTNHLKKTISNTWQRYEFNFSANDFSCGLEFLLYYNIGTASTIDLLVWEGQAELGPYATSNIHTTTSTVTRPADKAYKTSSSSLIGQTEGTIFAHYYFDETIANPAGGTDANILQLNDGSNNNTFEVLHQGSDTGDKKVYFLLLVGGSLVINIHSGTMSSGWMKVAIAYKAGDYVVYVNGTQLGTSSYGSVPACSGIIVGGYYGSTALIKRHINKVSISKTRLSNSRLAELTTL
jgi:hypothetical protein